MLLLETRRLILRPYSVDDLDALFLILGDPKTMQFWPAPFTKEQSLQWIELQRTERYLKGLGRMAVIRRENQQLIGDCGIAFTAIDGKEEYDLGYIIHHPYWKRGFGSEAAEACLKYAFSHLKLKRLVANMAFDHLASQRTAEKLGMHQEKLFYNARNRNLLTCLYVKEFD